MGPRLEYHVYTRLLLAHITHITPTKFNFHSIWAEEGKDGGGNMDGRCIVFLLVIILDVS